MAEKITRSYINAYGDDLPAFRFVKFSDEGKVTLAGAGELAIGVSERNTRWTASGSGTISYVTPNGEPVSVVLTGICEVECGGDVSAGDAVASDANGKAVVAGVGNFVNGIALEDGVDGSRIKILITHIIKSTS